MNTKMKKIFSFALMGALVLCTFSSCSEGGDEGGNGNGNGNGKNPQITIVTSREGDMVLWGVEDWSRFSLAGNGTATIDWGDGSQLQEVTLLPIVSEPGVDGFETGYKRDHEINHTYTMPGLKTITITGDITGLFVSSHDYSVSEIDVTRMPGLKCLLTYSNSLTSIDLSNNPALEYLRFSQNQHISALDLSENTALKLADCIYLPNLTELNIGANTSLEFLYCINCENLSELDLRGCSALIHLDCTLDDLRSSINNMSALYVDGCTALTDLRCIGNNLTSLDVRGCTALERLHCNLNNLSALYVSGCANLNELWYSENDIHLIDLSGCTGLRKVICERNSLNADELFHLANQLPILSEDDRGQFFFSQQSDPFSQEQYGQFVETLQNKFWWSY